MGQVDILCSSLEWKSRNDEVKWLQSEGCPWDERTCTVADYFCYHQSKDGRVEMLQWLPSQGCPWDGRTLEVANNASYQWAIEYV